MSKIATIKWHKTKHSLLDLHHEYDDNLYIKIFTNEVNDAN